MALFNKKAKKLGLPLISDSAGIYAAENEAVSENSKKALLTQGINLEYASKSVSSELMEEYDYIFGMTQSHTDILLKMYPRLKNKIYPFPNHIEDPFGCDFETYRKCLIQIKGGIDSIIQVFKEYEL